MAWHVVSLALHGVPRRALLLRRPLRWERRELRRVVRRGANLVERAIAVARSCPGAEGQRRYA